jgi:hypothetical protein
VKPFGAERLASSLRRAMDWHRDAVSTRGWIDRIQQDLSERRQRVESVLVGGDVPNWPDDPRTQEFELDARGASPLTRTSSGGAGSIRAALPRRSASCASQPPRRVALACPRATSPRCMPQPFFTTSGAYNLLQRHTELAPIAALILSALRRVRGHGYPQGLAGEEIPMASRILAVAIAYEAMTTARPHRAAIPSSEAVLELYRCRGTQSDPAVVEAFVQILSLH